MSLGRNLGIAGLVGVAAIQFTAAGCSSDNGGGGEGGTSGTGAAAGTAGTGGSAGTGGTAGTGGSGGGGPTYDADIAPILTAKCNSCHGGTIAPTLTNYTQVIIEIDKTPPARGVFLATIDCASGPPPTCMSVAPYGSLTAGEKQTLIDWVDNGSPEN